VVDALNPQARDFYSRHFGFYALGDDPNHLYLPLKVARKAFAADSAIKDSS
jgi:hypothetical protein